MKTEPLDLESLGEHLRRIRESRNLSLRQAAKRAGISSAYLSQLEMGKRGKRKKNDEYFGPHPQILKKLAELYHISPSDLFARAGYLGDDAQTEGVGEEREIDRLFDFVLLDPLLRQTFSVADKRAIIECYEVLAKRHLIHWAGEPDTHPTVNKSALSGLRCENGRLRAQSPNTSLTLKEVAQELECNEADVKKMIQLHQLHATENDYKELLVEKSEIHKFKAKAIHSWIHNLATRIPVANPHPTLEERAAGLGAESDEDTSGFAVEADFPAEKAVKRKKNRK
jgi:transcriptional regulator with XRE-family HTH domain